MNNDLPATSHYNNGVEEPEDEFVSYKTDTDQESTRTDSRASEMSNSNNCNYASSHLSNGIIANIKRNNDDGLDTLSSSIIVREHDDSSSSTCEESENEKKVSLAEQEKDEVQNKRRKKRDNSVSKTKKDSNSACSINGPPAARKRSLRHSNGQRIPSQIPKGVVIDKVKERCGQDSHFKKKCELQQFNTSEKDNLILDLNNKMTVNDASNTKVKQQINDMSPTVMIEELNLPYEHHHKKIILSPQNKILSHEEICLGKAKKQNTITSYFSHPTKKYRTNASNSDEKQNNEHHCLSAELSEIEKVEKSITPVHINEISPLALNHSLKDNHFKGSRHHMRKLNISYDDCKDLKSKADVEAIESTGSEISETESDEHYKELTAKKISGASMVLSKRGRKIVKPNYIYDSSSEQTSDTEFSRTGSPLIGKISARSVLILKF